MISNFLCKKKKKIHKALNVLLLNLIPSFYVTSVVSFVGEKPGQSMLFVSGYLFSIFFTNLAFQSKQGKLPPQKVGEELVL